MIYVCIFLISTFLIYLYEKCSNTKLKKIYAILAVVIPSILAGIRGMSVGTDIKVYIIKNFDLAIQYKSLLKYLSNFGDSYAYWTVSYLVSRLTKNVNAVLFIYQLIIMIFTFYVCKNNMKRCPVYLSYFTFLILFYNRSLNMSRQTIAIVIVLYALKYLEDKKYIKYIIWIVIASLFHFTALSAIFILLIYIIIKSDKSRIFSSLIIILALVCLVFYEEIVIFLINIVHILPDKYLSYTVSNGYIKVYEIALKILFMVLISIYRDIISKDDKYNKFFMYCLVIDIILYFIGAISKYANRITYYFGYMSVIIYPQVYKIAINKNQKKCMVIIYIALMCMYWAVYYGFFNNDQTLPYLVNKTLFYF